MTSNNALKSNLYVVHCVDTEGPLFESLERTFDRVNSVFGLDLAPSKRLLADLQTGNCDLGGREDEIARMLNPAFLDLNDSWEKLRRNQDELFSREFRNAHADPRGKPWLINWFCCDHVGFTDNPSRREIGLHKIYDYYRDRLKETDFGDTLELHFHPAPHTKSSVSNAVHWFSTSTKLFEILSARIVEREWFPSSHRPGFHTERPDSHWFLEQFIPFDFANQAVHKNDEQPDLSGGRFGDWRRAPKTWNAYHPHHDDYQVAGGCRRSIFRCLNVGTRFRCLTQRDVDEAFKEARETGMAVLAFTDHDFRDQRPNVRSTFDYIEHAAARYSDVTWHNSSARQAASQALRLNQSSKFELRTSLDGSCLDVSSTLPTFGPQPYLAIKSRDGRYLHDAFDIHRPFHEWSYTFDQHSLPMDQVEAVGVASNSRCGQTAVSRVI